MKKKILLIATIAMMLLCLVACGKDKKPSVDGYYVFESSTHHDYAIEIKGSSVTIYTNGNNYPSEQHGTVEHTETGADLYIVREGTWENQFNDYSPLHVKISEDGTLMYLSSDNSNWTTDTYRKVDKDEFDAVVGRCVGVKAQSEDDVASNDVQTTTEGDVVVANDGMAMTMAEPEIAEDESYRIKREEYIRDVFKTAYDNYSRVCFRDNNDFDAYVNEMMTYCWTDSNKAYYEDYYKEYVSESEYEILKEMTLNEEDMNYLFNISFDVFSGESNQDEDGNMLMDFDYIENKLQ